MALSVQAIVNLRDRLERKDGARNDSYDKTLRYYAGATLRDVRRQGYVSGIEAALSYMFKPKEGDEDDILTTPINLIKPAIENKVAFLSLPPTVRVIEPPDNKAPGKASPKVETPANLAPPTEADELIGEGEFESENTSPVPPPPGQPSTPGETMDEDWATNFADRLERVIASLYESSNINKRCRDVAWSMCAMDGAVIGVWPDIRNGRPRFITLTPQEFYPISYDPDGLDLSCAIWNEYMTGDEIKAKFGLKGYEEEDDVKVTKCIDEENFYIVIDDTKFAPDTPVENPLGFVPMVCVGALGLPGMIFGSTNIRDAIPVAQWINYHAFLMDKMANAMVEPTIFVKDPLNVPPDLAIGKGGVATAGPQGGVELLGPIQLPQSFWQFGQTLQQWFDIVADNPAILRSDAGSGWVTAKGFNAQMGPVASRLQTSLNILMAAWQQVTKYALIMWANFPGADKALRASGKSNTDFYFVEATPDEFMVDGKIWTELICSLQAQSYMDRQGTAIELIQLYQNEMISWQTVLDNLPYVNDRKRERSRIDKDRKWKAQGLAMAQQMASSPATANVDPGAQERTNYGLERGFTGEVGAPPGPEGMMGPAPQGSAESKPPENVNLVEVLQEFFSGIQKLRGPVWFGGDPITAPQKFADDSWTVTVWVIDSQDIGTITRAAEKVEEIYGHIKFIQGEPGPDEQAIPVNGGASAEPPAPTEPPGVGMEELGGMLNG